MVSAVFLTVLTGCSMIDEDQSDCGKEAKMDYELDLITNMSIELRTQLNKELDKDVEEALREYLKPIFTDFAHDVDLSFYDTVGDSTRLYHDQHIMDANQRSYTLYLPMRDYMHLATANLVNNPLVDLTGDGYCHPSKLQQQQADTVSPHTTGLFTARMPMSLKEGKDQTFLVRLYMANCAAALVVDTQGHDASGMKVLGTGFASGFSICDSTFQFAGQAPIMKADEIAVKGGRMKCFCTVNFPSRKVLSQEQTRTVIETEEPFLAKPGEQSLWEFEVYAPSNEGNNTRSDRKITRTVLRVTEALNSGQLKIIKCTLLDDGSVVTDMPEVGVSVTLDWKPGGEYHPEI